MVVMGKALSSLLRKGELLDFLIFVFIFGILIALNYSLHLQSTKKTSLHVLSVALMIRIKLSPSGFFYNVNSVFWKEMLSCSYQEKSS